MTKFLEHMHDKKRKEVGLVATISSIFALRTCGIAMCLCINMNDQNVVLHIIRLWIEDEYVINHVLCLVTRFIPFPVTKRRQKFSWMCFFSRHHYNFHSIPFFVYAFYNYDSKARYLAQRQTNNCNCCQRAHTASFRCCRKMLLLIWFCGSNM